jgi:putative tricarboxylic transport membrane protein
MTRFAVMLWTLAALAVLGVGLALQGLSLRYWSPLGPGPGFFPVWIGSMLAMACAAMAIQVWRGRPRPEPARRAPASSDGLAAAFMPDGVSTRRWSALLMSLALLWLGLYVLGFRLAVLLFVLFVPARLEPQTWRLRLALALVFGLLVPWIFERHLQVDLPQALFPLPWPLAL